ncbi:uncharacterized protein FIBRA_00495 [Fibroporia radiculosa]|uniref:Heterokaryon incompatibility domain-containing protein n=1 Tax=Fibroporia radiculosa TaxID=599839 RepID=J4HRQ0_9APHY|nr:uncharacterized protein FIBRA_00495 [Fibroporia radiculosa]CCL98497.1 predicted protein [Fibroporia radiculosa]
MSMLLQQLKAIQVGVSQPCSETLLIDFPFRSLLNTRKPSFGLGGLGKSKNGSGDTESVTTPPLEQEASAVSSPSVTSPAAETPLSPPLSFNSRPLSDEAKTKKQKELFDTFIDDKLSAIPLRLIDTEAGKLRSMSELSTLFKETESYKAIESKILRATRNEMKAALDSFFEYAMFSHRWGAAEEEPTFQNISSIPADKTVFDLTEPREIRKLKQFCTIAKENGYRWAWSDTCCIDKTNNVELQESIISMFSWYRLSAVTIVYLSDAMDEESLRHSVWFTRGWTLQELIAPRIVWFYKQDWTPYIDSKQNHKEEERLAEIITEVTSIEHGYLNDFQPGLRDVKPNEVRKRMQWLARRRTTKVEDMAYCMMGIFGVHMPVMYGEKNNAFVRLQKEIMNLTDDLSLFDWVGEPSDMHTYFASHPACFARTVADKKDDGSLGVSYMLMYKTSKTLSTLYTASLLSNVKKLLLDPPHGHFIANGKMNMPLFVHDVRTLTPESKFDPPALDEDGLIRYSIKAEGLALVEFTTNRLLPLLATSSSDRSGPTYRLVRMWETGLIPPEEITPETESPSEPAESSTKSKLAESLGAVVNAVSQTAVAMFLTRLRQPFVALLLMRRSPDDPFERVGTMQRIIAKPSAGNFEFRPISTLIVK